MLFSETQYHLGAPCDMANPTTLQGLKWETSGLMQEDLERKTAELLQDLIELNMQPPPFQFTLTVMLSDMLRFKISVSATEDSRVNDTLMYLYTVPMECYKYHSRLRDIRVPAVQYLETARASVRETADGTAFTDPRHMQNEDFDLTMSVTMDRDLTHSTSIVVRQGCSENLRSALMEGNRKDTVWAPMKRVMYYVLHKTYTDAMKGRQAQPMQA